MNFLQDFLKHNEIKSVVDVGCGDWSFSQYIDWKNISYIGYDVVKSVIERNIKKYSDPSCLFVHANALTVDLPSADLLICKDVLQHISNENVLNFLKQIGKFKYCLITNDTDFDTETSLNSDTEAGGYRTLDLTKEPFGVKGVKALSYIAHGSVKKQILLVVS